jgi:translation initiation factor 2 subunit 2
MKEDYYEMLDRASGVTKQVGVKDRFSIPDPEIFYEGRTSVLENFRDIVNHLNRDEEHLMKFLLKELGTAGKIKGEYAVLQGKFMMENVKSVITSYADEFVICSECGRPDTHLLHEDHVLILKCDACGAHRPVRKRRR